MSNTDQKKLTVALEKYRHQLVLAAAKRVGWDNAEDVIQSTLLGLKKLPAGIDENGLRNYLFRALVNQTISFSRHKKAGRRFHPDGDVSLDSLLVLEFTDMDELGGGAVGRVGASGDSVEDEVLAREYVTGVIAGLVGKGLRYRKPGQAAHNRRVMAVREFVVSGL